MNTDKSFPVADPAPYAPIRVTGPNLRTAQMLSQAIGCAKSELSAVTTYEYQHWTQAACQPALAGTIARIGMVEMRHLDTLGQLVVLLGGDPRYLCSQRGGCTCWNAGMISYSRDVRTLLMNNIADEKKAEEFYRTTAREIDDACVCAVLERLAADEALHVQIFTRYANELCR